MKRIISIIIALSLLLSFVTAFAENDVLYLYEDAGLGRNNWQLITDYDKYHKAVYQFSSADENSESDELFTDEFEDGTYIISMDFKFDGIMATDSSASIEIESETSTDKTSLHMFENGDAKIEVRDAQRRRLRATLVKTENDWTLWKNYSVIYEKVGDELSITQYLDGEKLYDAVTSYDNFRLKKILISHPTSDTLANLYIDNISCRKISDSEPFAFEEVAPVEGDGDAIDYFEVKLNRTVVKSSVSQISVLKEDNTECITEYETVGQYIYVKVNNLGKNDRFTLTVTGIKDLFNNTLAENVYSTIVVVEPSEVLHSDCDALLDSAKWTNVENYDEEHGTVYSFSAGAEHRGSDWFTEEFADGTYVVSMDFKVPAYPESGTQDMIMVDSEEWRDRTLLYLRTDGILAYEIQDAGGTRQSYTYKYGTNYLADAWNNYSIVYEKSGTDVDVTQYVNGVKIKSSATRISDNFRFKRITVLTDAASPGIYLDNIIVMRLGDSSQFTANVAPCNDGKISVEFNSVPLYSTFKSVKVKDADGKKVETGEINFIGNVIEIELNDGTDNEEYSVTFNTTFTSVTGIAIKQDTGGGGESSGGEIGVNQSIYGAIIYSAGEDQIFELDATLSDDDVRHGKVLDLISENEAYVGLKDELKAKLDKEEVIISCDFKVGDTAYLNNIGVLGKQEGVRIRRSGHARQNFLLSNEFLERIGPTGGALIKEIPWPEDGRWTNICFVTTSSGVEFYLDNEYLAKSLYGIGNIIDVFAHFKPANYSQIDNFMIIDKNDYLLTAITSNLTAYENDDQTEICVSFTAPITKDSISGISVKDAEGNAVDIGEPEVAGANVYIPLLNGEEGEKYSVTLPNIEGIAGMKFQKGPELVETSQGSVVRPSLMKCAFEDFSGDRSAYAMKVKPLATKVMLTFSGLFSKEELQSQIHVYCGNQSIPFEINIQEDAGIGITVVECMFDEVLKPNSDYRIDISGALTERIANELTLGETKSYSFRTEDCEDIVTLSGIADGVVEKDVQIYKKSGFSQAFFHAATKKSTVNMNIDGEERAVEKLDEFHYKVTQIPDSTEGVQTLSLDDFANCEYSLWTWPDLADMNK
ncbi:MAG: hypothetical protein K5768_03395 [Firmicutes bacterium]|nr:hypothetical protein [Bacillota bacterium]